MTVYLCECKHPKVRHQGGTYWCLDPDCACKRYTPNFQAPATDGESTSARLRRVEQERNELAVRAADLEQVRAELKHLRLLAAGYLEDIQDLESGQDEVISALRAQRDAARAELERLRRVEPDRAELAAAIESLWRDKQRLLAERNQLKSQLHTSPGWIIARAATRNCERCEHQIQRGHAYREQPGTGGLVEHVYCPDGAS